MKKLEFWFDFASTYSYLSAFRIERYCSEANLELVWQPFLLGPIFQEQGWSNSPFVLYPSKGKYMWKDMERCSQKYDLAFQKPDAFPRNGLLAARIALAAQNEPWLSSFVKSIFSSEFAENKDISREDVIAEILKSLGLDSMTWLGIAQNPETKNALRANTERAKELEIFGAPTFVIDNEIFWGNDRLEDACKFALR